MRIAPNNNLPATHFIEVWNSTRLPFVQESGYKNLHPIKYLSRSLEDSDKATFVYTVAIFRIRENKLPTLHNFKNK